MEYNEALGAGLVQQFYDSNPANKAAYVSEAPTQPQADLEVPQADLEVPQAGEESTLQMPSLDELSDVINAVVAAEAYPTPAEVQPPAAVEKVTVNPYKGLLDLIAAGEGEYNSSNRGTLKNKIQGSTHNTKRDNKPLTEMTIAEIKVKQAITDPNDKNRLFAIGRYQLIPTTFNMAVKSLDLDENTKFTEDVQDKFGEWLLKSKRSNLGDYLNGESDDRDAALLDLAKEWASIPVHKNTKRKENTILKGNSYYGGGNKAHHTVEAVEKVLDAINRPKVIKAEEPATRGEAFKAARKRGDKTFMWKGKKFTTEMA